MPDDDDDDDMGFKSMGRTEAIWTFIIMGVVIVALLIAAYFYD